MTAGERLDAYLCFGLDLYVGRDDRLHVRGPLPLRDAARLSLAMHRDELIAELKRRRDEAIKRLTRAGVPSDRLRGVK